MTNTSTAGPPGNKGINYPPVSSVDSAKNWDVYPLTPPAQPDWNAVLNGILAIDCSTCIANVCLASLPQKDEMPQYQRLQMSDSLARAFLGVAEEVLRQGKRGLDKNELVLRPYDAGSKPDPHEVEYIHVSDQGHIKNQLIPLESFLELNEFKQENDFVEGLRFYVIVVQPKEGSPIYFFRSYSAKREITRSRWDISAVMQENNYFNRITAPIFLFDKEIDCIVRDERLFIFDQGNFHKRFRFFEYARQVGDETLRAIQKVVPIINFESFANSCRNHGMVQFRRLLW